MMQRRVTVFTWSWVLNVSQHVRKNRVHISIAWWVTDIHEEDATCDTFGSSTDRLRWSIRPSKIEKSAMRSRPQDLRIVSRVAIANMSTVSRRRDFFHARLIVARCARELLATYRVSWRDEDPLFLERTRSIDFPSNLRRIYRSLNWWDFRRKGRYCDK